MDPYCKYPLLYFKKNEWESRQNNELAEQAAVAIFDGVQRHNEKLLHI
jgi:hypothetical protein